MVEKGILKIGEKVTKLWEAGIFSCITIIKDVLPKLGDTVGQYEMAVVLWRFLVTDGSLLIPLDNMQVSCMHLKMFT